MAISGPSVGQGTMCEVQSVVISSTAENIRLSNFTVLGACTIAGVGRHHISNIGFSGAVTVGEGSTKFMTFMNCEFNSGSSLTISNLLASTSALFFINCNFSGSTLSVNSALLQQVIFSNCAGFSTFSPTKAIYSGLNSLASGIVAADVYNINTKYINGVAIPNMGYRKSYAFMPSSTTVSVAIGDLSVGCYIYTQSATQSAM